MTVEQLTHFVGDYIPYFFRILRLVWDSLALFHSLYRRMMRIIWLWAFISFFLIHELDICLNEFIGLFNCISVDSFSPLVLAFGLFLIEGYFFNEIYRMVSLYAYFASLLWIIWHLLLLCFASQDGVGHRFQTVQFFHNFFAWGIISIQASLWPAWQIFLFCIPFSGCGIER